jgi:hypothetical protein
VPLSRFAALPLPLAEAHEQGDQRSGRERQYARRREYTASDPEPRGHSDCSVPFTGAWGKLRGLGRTQSVVERRT